MGVGRAVFGRNDIADWIPYIIVAGIAIYLYFRQRSGKKYRYHTSITLESGDGIKCYRRMIEISTVKSLLNNQ